MRRRLLAAAAAVLGAAGLLTAVVTQAPPARALSGSDFQAGSIISDSQFYDSSTMSPSAIQAFLSAKLPSCASGYTCLPRYSTATTAQPSQSGLCNGYGASSSQSAATILYNVARSCGINPQVLIVMLEKEQGLVTDPAPSQTQYDYAMGANCPDTTGCSAATRGFFIQVYTAAYQFKYYRLHADWYSYSPGRYNTILYNPNTKCGSSQVYIQNWATALLYIYTPYQPNAAALANLYGSGDSCSAYGNRNFWRDFNNWFGNPSMPYDAGGLFATSPSGAMWFYNNSGRLNHPYSSSAQVGTGGWQNYSALASGDVDGDGRADMVAVSPSGGLYLSLNSGTYPTFGSAVQIGWSGWNNFSRLYLADVNGDGYADLVGITRGGAVYLYQNQPGARQPFINGALIAGGWNAYPALTVADVDGDGRADVVSIDGNGVLWLMHNTGSASKVFAAPQAVGTGWGGYNRIVATDIDLDGRADLLATTPAGQLWLAPATGSATAPFGSASLVGSSGWQGFDRLLPATVPVPRHQESADLYATNSAGALFDAPNASPPTPFPVPSTVSSADWSQYDVLGLGDVRGSGRDDAFVRTPAGRAYLYANSGDAAHPYGSATYVGSGWQAYDRILVGDVTNDGFADIVARTPAGALWLYRNTGYGHFYPALQIGHSGWQNFATMTLADATGDGRDDLVVSTSAGVLLVYPNTGNASRPFATGTAIGTGWQSYDAVLRVAGRPGMPDDLVARSASDGTLWYYRNTGSATSPYPVREGPAGTAWSGFGLFASGDVDGDGMTDLVGANANGVQVSLGRDPAPLAAMQQIGAYGWQNFDKMAAGDLDGDGLTDVVATKPDGTLWTYRNGGNSSHPFGGAVKVGSSGWQQFATMAAGDVTGDGKADLVLSAAADGSLWLYPNSGSATSPFSANSRIGTGFGAFTQLMLADVNGDGLADLIGVKNDGTLWLSMNTHNAATPFGPLQQVQPGSGATFVAFTAGDVNHDGYADLLGITAGGAIWYFANTGLPGANPWPNGIRLRTDGWGAYNRFLL